MGREAVDTTGRAFLWMKLSWEKGQRRWNLERSAELRDGLPWRVLIDV